jgi:hypothetical protein
MSTGLFQDGRDFYVPVDYLDFDRKISKKWERRRYLTDAPREWPDRDDAIEILEFWTHATVSRAGVIERAESADWYRNFNAEWVAAKWVAAKSQG